MSALTSIREDSFTFKDLQYLLDDVGSLATKRGVAPNMALFELSDSEALKQLRRRNEFVNRRKDVALQMSSGGTGGLTNPAFQAGVDAHNMASTKEAVQQAFFIAMNLFGLFVLYKMHSKT